MFAAVVIGIDWHESGEFRVTRQCGRRQREHGRTYRPTFHLATLAEAVLVAARDFARNFRPIVEHLPFVLARSIVDALHSLGTALRSDGSECRRLRHPLQTMRIDDVQAKVRRAFNFRAVHAGLVAEAQRFAFIMELVIESVLFAFVLARRRLRVHVFARLACHGHETGLLVVVKRDIAQLHFTAGIIGVLHGDAVVRLCHVHFGAARRANNLAVHLTHANLFAADFYTLCDIVAFAFE